MKYISKFRICFFIAGVFVLWYLFPLIPVDRLIEKIPKTFAYHNLSVRIIVLLCIVLSAVLNMFGQFGLVYEACRLKLNIKKLVAVLLISIALIFLSLMWTEHFLSVHYPKIFPPNQSYWIRLLAIMKNLGSSFISRLPQRGVINFLIISLCFSFGSLVSYIVREKNLLLPVMLCAAFIDFWTCTQGFVSKTLAKAPEIVSGVSSGVSMIGGSKLLGVNIATIGPGDFIFASLVFAVVFRFGLNGRKNFIFMFSFLTLGMLLIVLGVLPFLPALICIACGTILSNYKEFILSKDEKSSLCLVFAFLLFLYTLFKYLVK